MTTQTISIGITGVTGAVGGAVARRLADAGLPQRLLARSPDRAPRLPGATVHAVACGDHDASVAALTCVTTLLMVSAAEDEHRLAQHVDFVDAAAESGVRDVVYTSFADACGGGPADRVHVGHSCEPRARHQLYIT